MTAARTDMAGLLDLVGPLLARFLVDELLRRLGGPPAARTDEFPGPPIDDPCCWPAPPAGAGSYYAVIVQPGGVKGWEPAA